jgi:hypothetical protein
MFEDFKNLAKDKQLHFYGGAAISVVVSVVSGDAQMGMLAALLVGAGKEAYDQVKKVNTLKESALDLTATLGGGLLAGLAYAVLQSIG